MSIKSIERVANLSLESNALSKVVIKKREKVYTDKNPSKLKHEKQKSCDTLHLQDSTLEETAGFDQ